VNLVNAAVNNVECDMSKEWFEITRAVGRYEVQGTLDGLLRHRPKFYIVGQDPSARTWRPGEPPIGRHPAQGGWPVQARLDGAG
jgi:hypothetical protein